MGRIDRRNREYACNKSIKNKKKCIQKLREERGWSLEELAGRILLSPEELKCMENGIKEPDKMTVTLLGYILNVHADSLLNGEIHCRVSQTELMELMKETHRLSGRDTKGE